MIVPASLLCNGRGICFIAQIEIWYDTLWHNIESYMSPVPTFMYEKGGVLPNCSQPFWVLRSLNFSLANHILGIIGLDGSVPHFSAIEVWWVWWFSQQTSTDNQGILIWDFSSQSRLDIGQKQFDINEDRITQTCPNNMDGMSLCIIQHVGFVVLKQSFSFCSSFINRLNRLTVSEL